MRLVFKNATIITPYNMINRGTIVVEDGVVRDYFKGSTRDPDAIDLRGYIVAPGYVETHIHGLLGDYVWGGFSSLERIAKNLLRYGVVAFTPTAISMSHDELVEFCRCVRDFVDAQNEGGVEGARVVGIHLEGPYINPEMCGFHNPEHIREPNVNEFLEYYKASGGNLAIITIAPEMPNAMKLIDEALKRNVTVAIGHTNASYDIAKKAIDKGARRATHVFNAMRGIHHRDPGATIAILGDTRIYIEIIADLQHVHPEMVRFAIRSVGTKRTILVSDSLKLAGFNEGLYDLDGLKVKLEGSTIKREDGSILGSALTIDQAVRNIVNLGYNVKTAIRMASLNPALSFGRVEWGTIERTFDAHMIVLNKELEVVKTIIYGEIVWEKE